jgi:predicted phage tail protein
MEKGAKTTGLLVFVAGAVMLVIVFFSAMGMLNATRAASLDLNRLPQEGIALLARIGFLFVMGYVASAIAGRGIHLFEAAPTGSHFENGGGSAEK